jgi:hypothetical protein
VNHSSKLASSHEPLKLASAAAVLSLFGLAGCGDITPTVSAPVSLSASAPAASIDASPTAASTASTPASASTSTSTSAVPLPTNATLGTLATTEVAPADGTELDPASPGSTQTVGPAAAYSSMTNQGLFDPNAYPSTVELATYRNLNNPGIPTPGVSTSLWSQSVLVWVIVYNNIGPLWRGIVGPGPYVPSSAATASATPDPTDCDFVYLANAATGVYISAFGDCPGQLSPAKSSSASAVTH